VLRHGAQSLVVLKHSWRAPTIGFPGSLGILSGVRVARTRGLQPTGDLLVKFLQQGILAMQCQGELFYGCRKGSERMWQGIRDEVIPSWYSSLRAFHISASFGERSETGCCSFCALSSPLPASEPCSGAGEPSLRFRLRVSIVAHVNSR
jgi:hypothetical protein